jgi:hypothetical protein
VKRRSFDTDFRDLHGDGPLAGDLPLQPSRQSGRARSGLRWAHKIPLLVRLSIGLTALFWAIVLIGLLSVAAIIFGVFVWSAFS